MKFPVNKKVKIVSLTTFLFFIISYLLLFILFQKIQDHTKTANKSKENILHLEMFYSSLKGVEKQYQGYLLSARPQLLLNFNEAKHKVDSSINTFDLFVNDSTFIKNNKKLMVWQNQVIKIFDTGIIQFGRSGQIVTDVVKDISQEGSIINDSINDQITYMQTIERDLIKRNDEAAEDYFNVLKMVNFSSLTFAILIALYFIIIYFNENKKRHTIDAQALVYQDQLEQKIEVLNKSNAKLKQVKSIEKFAATGRMARMIAHEVRNPLTNIGLANDQLKDAIEHNDENLMLMNMIKRNGERINHLVGDLLNATKFVELNMSTFSINDLLDEVLFIAKDRILLSNTKITKHYADKLCNVLVDADKIKIAFLNVIINSIEALKNGDGEIQIITSSTESMCKVVIRDNGEGMNKEIISKIFEPFFTSKDKGNGLGLTNTQNIILNHKGFITVKSEVGKGTDFIFKLNFA